MTLTFRNDESRTDTHESSREGVAKLVDNVSLVFLSPDFENFGHDSRNESSYVVAERSL
jgi:hypothetical protein